MFVHIAGCPYVPHMPETWESLQFGNADEAENFYERYAAFRGFEHRRCQRHKRILPDGIEDDFKYVYLECTKRGFKKEGEPRKYLKGDTRCGCESFIILNYDPQCLALKITCWVDEHNHDLIPKPFQHLMKSNRKITPVQEKTIELLVGSGNKQRAAFDYLVKNAGGFEKLGFLKEDMKNMLNRKRQIKMERGEGTVLMNFF